MRVRNLYNDLLRTAGKWTGEIEPRWYHGKLNKKIITRIIKTKIEYVQLREIYS